MRLIKIDDDLINEDRFIGLFWLNEHHVIAKYEGANGEVIETNLSSGRDWRGCMRHAANAMLFDLDKEEQEE